MPPGELADQLAGIGRQAVRLSRLLDDLLDVSRITAQRMKLEPEEVDLCDVVRDGAARYGEDARRAGSAIELDTQGPARGRWDRLRIEQVVTNLVSNAIKYGGGKPIQVRVEVEPRRARVIVRDQGIGIAPDDLPRIFQPFERASATGRAVSLGLGLFISRYLVEAHGGTIRVESRPGAGSTFTVELPR
jgi:signal transduction histidine kinase